VRIFEDTAVTGMTVKAGRIAAVKTIAGNIKCESVVIAAGLWSPVLGGMIGIGIPQHAVQHFYILTKPIEIVTRDMPLFISYDERMYGREDVGGLLLGFFDERAIPVSASELPQDFSFGLLDGNWSQIEANMALALARFPVLHRAEIRTLLNGPESFTPDMQMLLGETPSVRGCFLATGMNSSGIALSAAAGRLTAEWILQGRPSLDATRLDIRRFAQSQSVPAYARERASEAVTHMCRRAAPDLDFATTRMIRRSPIHVALAAKGARFVSVLGWERPIWFVPAGSPPSDGFDHAAREVTIAETRVALFDRSSDAKFRLDGPRAETLLGRLCGAAQMLPLGGCVNGPMLNERAGVEALVGIARLGPESFLLLAEAEQATRLASWIEWHRPASGTSLVDVSSGFAAFHLEGPHAFDLLRSASGRLELQPGRVTSFDLGYAPAQVVPWLGADGFYVMVPTEFAAACHERLVDTGEALDLGPAGSLASEALALKRAMPRFGYEATPQISAVAVGLDSGLDPQVHRGFIGRGALLRQRQQRTPAKIRAFSLEMDGAGTYANAPVLCKGRLAGHVTRGAFIPSLGKVIVLALVKSFGEDASYCAVVLGRELALRPYEFHP
jgi:glycine cleavage system aminomethyltransferase T